jgi:hypothetical protein
LTIDLEIWNLKKFHYFLVFKNDLIDMLTFLQSKCFISTIIEIAQHYNLSRESFLAALRSYQEAHNNYFEDLEEKVLIFPKLFILISTTKFR